jgi:predicted amidohydrolase YtcJ
MIMQRAHGVAVFVFVGVMASPAFAQTREACGEMVLHNGRITTMDGRNTTASSLVIRGDRIVSVGTASGTPPHSACATVIDLQGRRVIPGMIDTHSHPSYFTARPGHYVVLDSATSIADVQAKLRERAATVPPGGWITSLGGWSVAHIAEQRMPTAAELDAAVPNHPVLLALGGFGRDTGAANSLGRKWLAGRGVTFDNDQGALTDAAVRAAINALRATMTFEDQKRQLYDLLAYYASMGVTTQVDNGGPAPPNPALERISAGGDGGLNTIDPATGYLPHVALDREGRLPGRLRVMFYSRDLTPEVPLLKDRFDNQMMGFGSDWLRVSGVGERVVGGDRQEWLQNGQPTPQYEAAVNLIAERGWTLQQHADVENALQHVDLWEKVNARVPLAPLRWTLAHGRGFDESLLGRLKAMGVAVSIAGGRYLSDGKRPQPRIKSIVESGVRVSYGSDNPSNPPINPWLHMYAIVTGRNFQGNLIEGDQTLSRLDALRLYTINGAWFSRDEERLGSLEVGKLADLVVLSEDFVDPARVPDAAIKNLRSVLTVVGGRIVHNPAVLSVR